MSLVGMLANSALPADPHRRVPRCCPRALSLLLFQLLSPPRSGCRRHSAPTARAPRTLRAFTGRARRPSTRAAPGQRHPSTLRRGTPQPMNSDSDLQIAGDILAVPHLLQPAREHPATVAEFAGLARSIAADRAPVGAPRRVRRHHPLVPPAAHRPRLRGLAAVLGARPGQRAARPRRSSGVLTVLRRRADRAHRARHPRPRARRTAGLRPRLRPRGRQRRARTGRQPARLLPRPHRDADARGAPRCAHPARAPTAADAGRPA